MAESVDLGKIRRDAFLRALHRAAQDPSVAIVTVSSLSQTLSLPLGLLRFVIDPLVSEGLITTQGAPDSGSVVFTEKGMLEANEVINRKPLPKARVKILCIDTEPETASRLKDAGHSVFEASMGYRTGKRDFPFPPPNEMNLIVCDLRHPACFDSRDWGPSGSNDNFRCRVLPHEQVNNTFYVTGGLRRAQHQMIHETQLGKPIPGTFGPGEIKRAIVEGGVPFLLFLNEEWLGRVGEIPNWLDVKWSFLPTVATEVGVVEPLPTLLPEMGREVKFKLAIQHRIGKGPLFGLTPPRFSTDTVPIVTNNIGDVFGQFVRMGRGSVWMLPSTHHNADVLELIALRLEKARQPVPALQEPSTAGKESSVVEAPQGPQVQLDARLGIPGAGEFDRDLPAFCATASAENPLSLIMLDIDHFKSVNDRFGHEVGNQVLKQVSDTLTAGCRGKGTVYRYGGDEIAILLQNYTLPEAEAIAERLRVQVACVRGMDNPPAVTASIGVATFPEPVRDAGVLFKSADDAAYASKNNGRNQVHSAGGSVSEVRAANSTKPRKDLLTVPALRQLKDPSIAKYPFFGVDQVLTVVPCPDPDRGWPLSNGQVDLKTTTARFEFSKDLQAAYSAYKVENYEAKKFVDDRHLFMLTKNPRVFTDASTLVLEVKEVLFSEVLFFREVLLRTVPDLLARTLDDLTSGNVISFPHGMSMQMVVVTRDSQILITKRSHKTEWYPGHWSCSLEENLSVKDFDDGRQGVEVVRHWAKRGLNEELGLHGDDYFDQNVRILSVFVESDLSQSASVLNICLCALVLLEIDSPVLAAKLNGMPRKDYEFSEFQFVLYDEMFRELTQPTRQYHPTSRYRMALALVQRHGEEGFAQQFLSKSHSPRLA
jgi:diguanylate cyclase (GGDEF)-like protein